MGDKIADNPTNQIIYDICYEFQEKSYTFQSDEREVYGLAGRILHMTQFRLHDRMSKKSGPGGTAYKVVGRSLSAWPDLVSGLNVF